MLALQEKKQMVFEGVAEGKFAGMARFSTPQRPSSPLEARARATGAHAEATEKQRVVAIRNQLYTADSRLVGRAKTPLSGGQPRPLSPPPVARDANSPSTFP